MHAPRSNSLMLRTRGGAVHARRYGDGPPLVLLHESPRSTHKLDPLARHLAETHTVYALDTPGYGLSDPLTLRYPEIDDFADAIADALTAAGLGPVPVYGTHTGATVAAALALRHRKAVTGLLLDGYPVFTQKEREEYETNYLVPFDPDWEGTHVVRLWSRVRDQYGFFPWYLRGRSTALPAAPSLRHQREVFDDFLRAGPNYLSAYAASFRFRAAEVYEMLDLPCHIIARTSDMLHDQMDRLPAPKEGNTVTSCPAAQQPWLDRVTELFAILPRGGYQGEPLPAPDADGVLRVTRRAQFYRCYGMARAGTPVVLLHDIPGSGTSADDVAQRLSAAGPVIVPELPGCGLSDIAANAEPLAAQHEAVAQVMTACAVPSATVLGLGRSASLARAVVSNAPNLALHEDTGPGINPAPTDPPLPQRWDGADLLALWYEVRDMELQRAASEDSVAGLDPNILHATFVAHCLSRRGGMRILDALATVPARRPQ